MSRDHRVDEVRLELTSFARIQRKKNADAVNETFLCRTVLLSDNVDVLSMHGSDAQGPLIAWKLSDSLLTCSVEVFWSEAEKMNGFFTKNGKKAHCQIIDIFKFLYVQC